MPLPPMLLPLPTPLLLPTKPKLEHVSVNYLIIFIEIKPKVIIMTSVFQQPEQTCIISVR
jgi:hypothetical protein